MSCMKDWIADFEPDTLIADGFDDAIVGLDARTGQVIYDYAHCIRILMSEQGFEIHDAIEYMDFNVVGAYVGDKTPIFMYGESILRGGAENGEFSP